MPQTLTLDEADQQVASEQPKTLSLDDADNLLVSQPSGNIPQLSEYNPTLRQKAGDLLYQVRRSAPVEDILGKTQDETGQMLEPRPTGLVPNIIKGAKDLPSALSVSALDKVLPDAKVNPNDTKLAAVGKEAYNLAIGIPKFVTSGAGLITAPIAAAKPLLTTAAFGLDTLKNLGQQIYSSHKNWDSMTPAQKSAAVTDMVGTGALMAALGYGAKKISSQQPSTIGEKNALDQQSPTASNGNRGTQPVEVIQPKQGAAQNVPQTVARVRKNEVQQPAAPQPQTPERPPPQQPATPSGNAGEVTPQEIGKQIGVTFDGEWPREGKTPLLQYTWRESDVPKDSPVYGATFYLEKGVSPEAALSRAKSKAEEFGVKNYQPQQASPEPVKPESGKPTEPPKVAQPSAIAKVQDHVSEVASGEKVAKAEPALDATTGQRAAKEIKSELVSRLQAAIEKAPTEAEHPAQKEFDHYEKLLTEFMNTPAGDKADTIAKNLFDYSKQFYPKDYDVSKDTKFWASDAFRRRMLKRPQDDKITIDIPGDGTFTIRNTKEALGQILERAKRLETRSEVPVAVRHTGISKADREWIEKNKQTVHETTPLAGEKKSEPAPAPQKFRVGRSPQLYSVVEKLPQSDSEKENGEQAVTIRNDHTGETHIVMESDLSPVKEQTPEQKSQSKKSTVAQKLKSLGYTDSEISAMPKAGAKALAERGEKGFVGMGAAVPSEFSKAASSRDVYGIAERVRRLRENAEMTDPTLAGKGIAPEASVERGRKLLKDGVDPEKVMSDFEKTNHTSSDDFAAVRAHGETLARITNRVEENFGTDSPEFRAAYKTESDWASRTKAMQTEWAKQGHAQQGEVDIDTGTFSGLKRAYRDAHDGEELPIKDEKKAQELADENRRLFNENAQLLKQLGEVADRETKPKDGLPEKIPTVENTRSALREYTGGKMTQPQVRALWNYTKRNYIDKGNSDFTDIVQKTATDLGMSFKDVANGLGQPKSVRKLTDELWRKQTDARRVNESAKRWVRQTNNPALGQIIPQLARVMFALRVGFHGTVALGTHAPMVAFTPKYWPEYFKDYRQMYKMVFSRPAYEIAVQTLRSDPNFTVAQRAGLVNDPYKVEDFNNPMISQHLGKFTGAGNRGYFVLKILRQGMFNQGWDALPETMKTPEMAQAMSDDINHITGVVKSSFGNKASLALFAPRLLLSRAAFLVGDPYKAIETATTAMSPKKWAALPPDKKFQAINQVKQKATILAVAYGLLEANKYLLQTIGSNQQINTTDPTRSDFMKFKGAGMDFSYGNAMLNMARLPVRLWTIGAGDGGKLKHVIYPDESMYSAAGEFARSQASPLATLGLDLIFKGDYQNRPLPQIPGYGKPIPMPKRLAAQGIKPYTWDEYVMEQASPIPFQEAEREIWRNGFGLSDKQIKSMLQAAGTTAVMMGTGGRLTQDLQPRQTKSPLSE
jgi:hypothetical protein